MRTRSREVMRMSMGALVLLMGTWPCVARAAWDAYDPKNSDTTLQATLALHQEAQRLDQAAGSLAGAEAALHLIRLDLDAWRQASSTLQAAHATWMQVYDREVADFVARSRPVRTEDAYQQEEARVATFRRTLPRLDRLETWSATVLGLLADYAARVPQAASAVRGAAAKATQAEVAATLQNASAEIDESLHEAQVAYEVVSVQLKNRAELVRATENLWDTRLRSAAARQQFDDVDDMDRNLDRWAHDRGLVQAYRLELGARQVITLDKGEFVPLLALRAQRAQAALIQQVEDEAPRLNLLPDVVPIMQRIVGEMRQKHQDAMADLEQRAAADQAPYRAARLKYLTRLRPNPDAPAAACDTLRHDVAEAANLQSEQAFEEFVSTCVVHF